MKEEWVKIPDFTDYSISSYGRVRNDNRERMVKPSVTRSGMVKVGLYKAGAQYTRAVRLLVAETFVGGRSEKFDTPINLDGDQLNCRADNLLWRPRWFAWKYASQFLIIEKYVGKGPIIDRKSGVVYEDVVQASITNGLLVRELLMTLVTKTPIFPTWQIFDWYRQ
jgi:hypothetical protein